MSIFVQHICRYSLLIPNLRHFTPIVMYNLWFRSLKQEFRPFLKILSNIHWL